MNDRELLEMAAKAAGLDATFWGLPGGPWQCRLDVNADARAQGVKWDPINDDGDALRLAASLNLRVLPGKHKGDGCTVEAQRAGIPGCTVFRSCPAEQMRRAIVMTAAEIGRGMK